MKAAPARRIALALIRRGDEMRVALMLVVVTLAGCKSEPRACVKMKELCGTETSSCRDLRDDLQEQFGEGAVDTLDGCVLQANSCSEAAGCATGEAAKATAKAAGEFFGAFTKSVSPSSADECVRNARSDAERAGCRVGAFGKELESQAEQFADGVKRSR
jgi:hypothetical protein